MFTAATRSQNMYTKRDFNDMSPSFRLTMLGLLPLLTAILMLSGCQLGQTVMVSKGQAGGFREIINGQTEYCKLTSTPGVNISAAAQEAFVKYCQDVE